METLHSLFLKHPNISTDSRNVLPGSIFFALKGPSFNGNTFAAGALEKGASYAVVDDSSFARDARYILVADGLKALQELANIHRRNLTIPVLAITGSNGKTTTKELVRNVLSMKYKTVATKGNLNNHIGVPLSILSISANTEFAVIEMGANHQKEIESYCRIAEPDYGLITNVGKAHLEGFGGFEGVKKGKGELYDWISQKGKLVFLNGDNEHLKSMAGEYPSLQIISYGFKEDFYCSGKITSVQPLSLNWKCGKSEGNIRSSLAGVYNVENILSAVCIGNFFGVDAKLIDKAIEAYVPDNSRSQLVKKGSNTILLDAYNANPTSMEAALKNFMEMDGKHKVVFLGEMAELGSESEYEHRRIVEMLLMFPIDRIVLVGKNFAPFNQLVKCMYFEDSTEAAEWTRKNPVEDSLLLIKGSRSSKMEKVYEALG